MSLLNTYGHHVPYLRRFARALTGSQSAGDTYVRSTLEALSEESSAELEKLAPKSTLYRIFLRIWSSSGATLEAKSKSGLEDEKIYRLTPLPRQAFLLYALEGMAMSDIAGILDTDSEGVKTLISQAEAEIESELRTNVLIIEDEAFIAADIEGLVTELGHSVDNVVATHTAAIDAVQTKTPGLILADVQLADGSSGIEAVHEILGEISVPVIFITAFPERLLTGERPEPAYLISKPFEPANVKAAISQALYFHQS